jgi:hypothetical protein
MLGEKLGQVARLAAAAASGIPAENKGGHATTGRAVWTGCRHL